MMPEELSYGPVQVLPKGLLGFLQLKNAGKNPDRLSNTLSPSLDLFEWYMAGTAQDIIPAPATAALPTGSTGFQAFTVNPVIVPQQEIWWVQNFGVLSSALGATESVGFMCAIQGVPAAVAGTYMFGDRRTILTGTATGRVARAYANGFWVPPGYTFGAMVEVHEVTTAVTYNGTLRVVRMQI